MQYPFIARNIPVASFNTIHNLYILITFKYWARHKQSMKGTEMNDGSLGLVNQL